MKNSSRWIFFRKFYISSLTTTKGTRQQEKFFFLPEDTLNRIPESTCKARARGTGSNRLYWDGGDALIGIRTPLKGTVWRVMHKGSHVTLIDRYSSEEHQLDFFKLYASPIVQYLNNYSTAVHGEKFMFFFCQIGTPPTSPWKRKGVHRVTVLGCPLLNSNAPIGLLLTLYINS
jgi:hypothetical protein